MWDETFQFVVETPVGQHLRVEVRDGGGFGTVHARHLGCDASRAIVLEICYPHVQLMHGGLPMTFHR